MTDENVAVSETYTNPTTETDMSSDANSINDLESDTPRSVFTDAERADTKPNDEVILNQAPVADDGEEAVVTTTEEKPAEGDFGWVPEPFMKEGQPDYKLMAKSYTELRAEMSKDRELAPETADAYKYEFTTEGFTQDAEKTKSFRTEAHKLGITDTQMNFLMSSYEAEHAGITEQVMSQLNLPSAEDTEKVLKSEWGGDYEKNVTAAVKAWYQATGAYEFPAIVGNSAEVIKVLATFGGQLKEDSVVGQTGATPVTVGLSREELIGLRNDPDRWDPKSPAAIKLQKHYNAMDNTEE